MKNLKAQPNFGPTVTDAKEAMAAYQAGRRTRKAKPPADHWKPTWHLNRFKAEDLGRTSNKLSYGRFAARELACLWNDETFWEMLNANPSTALVAKFISENYFRFSERALRACLRQLTWAGHKGISFDRPHKAFFAMVQDRKLRLAFFQLLFQEFEKFSTASSAERRSQVDRFKKAGLDNIFAQYFWFHEFDLQELVRTAGLSAEDLRDLLKIANNFAADIRSVINGQKCFPDTLRLRKPAKLQIKSLRIIDTLVKRLKDNPELPHTRAALQLERELPKKRAKPVSAAMTTPKLKKRRNLARTNLRGLAKKADSLVKFRERITRNPVHSAAWSLQKAKVL